MILLKSSLLAGHASDILIVLVLQLFTMPIYELPKKAAYLLCMTKLLYKHRKGRERHSLICKAKPGFMHSAMTGTTWGMVPSSYNAIFSRWNCAYFLHSIHTVDTNHCKD